MAMKYDTVTVTVGAGQEGTEEIMTDYRDVARTVHKITCESVADVDLIGYRESVKEIDIPTNARPLDYDWLEYEQSFAPGQSFRVGFRNGSGSSITKKITVQFEVS